MQESYCNEKILVEINVEKNKLLKTLKEIENRASELRCLARDLYSALEEE